MGERNTPEQSRAYTEALRQRRHQAGLVRKDIYVHPDDWPAIKAAIERKAKARSRHTKTDSKND
ncbi:MAG: hypothetical protein EOM91_22200 [Sphingobacteriia bacterium]|nr:hypothetical protein [Sphingobacteriia bacterium]